MKSTAGKGILSRLLVDAAVGLGILGFAALMILYSIETGKNPPMLWIELAAFTWITFYYPVQQHRRHWHRLIFWFGVCGLLAIHLLAFVIVLRSYPQWRLVWFIPVAIAEGGGVFLMLAKLFGYAAPEPRHPRNRQKRSGTTSVM